jgi:RNA polymerase sigma factor (sigma-70 family)
VPANSDTKPEPDMKELLRIARWEAKKLLTGSSTHVKQDVVQSAVAEYLSASAKQDVDVPGALMRIIARRQGIGYRNDWEKQRSDLPIDHHGFADDADHARTFEPASEETPAAVALAIEARRKRIAKAVGQLDPIDREIVQHTYLADFPLKAPAVAKLLGLKPGTVRNRLVEIRRRLAGILGNESE